MNTEAKELRKQNEALEDILSRLIALKNYKDRHGKDEHYLKEQPVLWQVARETLYQCVGTPVPVAESGLHLADVSNSVLIDWTYDNEYGTTVTVNGIVDLWCVVEDIEHDEPYCVPLEFVKAIYDESTDC